MSNERAMDPNQPEPPPHGQGREVTPLVVKDLELRSRMGAEKYGETLRAFNGRNPLVDLYQELLDAVQYLRQRLEEDRSGTAENSRARGENAQTREALTQKMIDDGYWTAREHMNKVMDEELDHLVTRADEHVMPALPEPASGESIAQEAHRIVLGDRGEAYGHPIFDMTRTADMLTALLRHKLRPGARLEAEDVGQAMIAVKQSRHQNKPKRDNEVDIAGYALCLEMIAEWRRANPGVDPRDCFPSA